MIISLKELNELLKEEYYKGWKDGYHEAVREATNEIGKNYIPKRLL